MKDFLIFCICVCCLNQGLKAQTYTSAEVFAHNDYVRARPFYTAYNLGVGYIEADVFLQDGELMVAHHKHEIASGRDLETLYLKPLSGEISRNGGSAYKNQESDLTLMIDLKTEGVSTLSALVKLVNGFPALTSCRTLQILVSGNVPDPDTWKDYPSFIYFDGRPAISYNDWQLKRIGLISTGFGSHSKWDGRSKLTDADRKKIVELVTAAHQHGKKFRFWATPDFPEAWKELMALKMDVIVTDDVVGLVKFLKSNRK